MLKVYDNSSVDEGTLSIIITHILKALLFLHNKDIVLRDIKPENILFSKKEDYSTLKLIDFGLSSNSKENQRKSVGSPNYMSPESISGNTTPKSDLWAVGVILFLLLTGKYPFKSNTTEELFH